MRDAPTSRLAVLCVDCGAPARDATERDATRAATGRLIDAVRCAACVDRRRDGAMPGQMDLLSAQDPHTEAAIKRAGDHANDRWKIAAMRALIAAASDLDTLTIDDVWERLTPTGHVTHENRAMGAIMKRGAALGYIEATTEHRPLRRVTERRHGRPVRVWRSLIDAGSER